MNIQDILNKNFSEDLNEILKVDEQTKTVYVFEPGYTKRVKSCLDNQTIKVKYYGPIGE